MPIEDLLSRLDRVRSTGKGQWTACCPSHSDKSPSLAITEKDDGRVLIKCFAECGAADVLAAIGLTMEALFPERENEHRYPKVRSAVSPRQVLECLQPEILCIALIGRQMMSGIANDKQTQQALITACSRVSAAHSYVENL